MLLKLLKYELKSSYAKILAAFGIYVIINTVMMLLFKQHDILLFFISFVGLVVLWAMTFITLFQRYNTNLYGSEGYLMFTLPVRGRMLLLSKVISAFIWLTLLIIITVASVFMYSFYVENGKIFDLLYKIKLNFSEIILFVIGYFINIIINVISIYFAITVSKMPVFRKFGVVMGIAAYFVVCFVSAIPAFFVVDKAPVKVNADSIHILSSAMGFTYIQLLYDVALCVLIFFVTAYLCERRTSLK